MNGIQQYWSGQFGRYHVQTKIHEVNNINKADFVVDVKQQAPLGIRSHVDCQGCGAITYYQSDGDFEWIVAHEVGHVLGFGDAYNRATNQVYSGWNGNIMAERYGKVEQRNIQSLVGDK
jgi:hypothetical protein